MPHESTPWHEEHVLLDGTRVTLRPIAPEDKGELRRQFERLSPESRERRFLSAQMVLTDGALRHLTEVDGDQHVAIVAVCDSPDLKRDVGLGIARFVRLTDEPDVAEAAVTVVDDMHRKGLGRLLVQALADQAQARGVRTFRGEVLATNLPMRRLLEEAGATIRQESPTTVTFDVPLGKPAEPGADNPLRRLLRAVAAAVARFTGNVPAG